VKKRHRILVIVIRRSWPGQSAQACSSDVFPLPTGAEMIVTRFRTAVQRGGQVVTADRPLPGRACRDPRGRHAGHRAISSRQPVSVTRVDRL
jgi:hypothetical protein